MTAPARGPVVFELNCVPQFYAWGKVGMASAVARFGAESKTFVPDAETPYAELWMGAHPKAPSLIKVAAGSTMERDFAKWLQQNPWALSDRVAARFGGELPYLFKVLSIEKALSIQAHPNKAHAEQLFLKDPGNYPDSNHKPEIAIALTDFQVNIIFL